MKKNGFVLSETLIVTVFVSGILIYLFIQFTNLTSTYSVSYDYNTVEGLYSLRNIRDYIIYDIDFFTNIKNDVTENNYLDIKNCTLATSTAYCEKIFELEKINKIYVVKNNDFSINMFSAENEGFKKFISKINKEGSENYRLLVEFTNSTYATIRFG